MPSRQNQTQGRRNPSLFVRRRRTDGSAPSPFRTSFLRLATCSGTNETQTTPPFLDTMSKISSGTFLGQLKTPLTLLCENITGALLSSRNCLAQPSLTWLASTIMPMRFISLIAERPRCDNSPCTGPTFEVLESAKALLQTCVRV
jgi:hypothetical protein